MASRADLYRAGMEGFAIVEEYIDKRGRSATRRTPAVQQGHMQGCLYQHQPSQGLVHQVKPAEEKMNSYEVVQFCNGVAIMDYSKRKPRAMGY